MTGEELINQKIPPLKLRDSGQQALNWMNTFRVSHLPVIDDDLNYKGIVSENSILESGNAEKRINEYPLESMEQYVSPSMHFYEIIKLALENNMQVVAVVDDEGKFMGAISVNDTASTMAQMFASQGPGGILVISMKENQYSLAEISRLIESNDTKVISSVIANDDLDSSMIKLTLKLNKSDLSRVIATLERYNYRIIGQFQETELLSNDKERLDLLFKYLNI